MSENKLLSKGGVTFASEIASNLEKAGLGTVSTEGSQKFFTINDAEVLKRHKELSLEKQA